MFTAFLIKYAEIGVKGKNRYLFENALVQQIKYALKRCEGEFAVRRTDGRIYVDAVSDFDYEETVVHLQKVFGISGICPMVYVEDEGFEKLKETIVDYIGTVYPDRHKSFKVAARRARKNYPLNSMEINMELGGAILDAFPEMSVDVHKPDILLNVEIRDKVYIYSRIIPGPGGMPYIFMRRLIPVNGRNRRWWIWRPGWRLIRDRSIYMLSTLRTYSCISMTSVRMMS